MPLMITRRVGEAFEIIDNEAPEPSPVRVSVNQIRGNQVRIMVEADKRHQVLRDDAKKRNKTERTTDE